MNTHDIGAIKHALSLIDLVLRDGHVIRRSGAKQRLLCPFHEEKTPSCFVDDFRFHCFGCGAGGDVFEYIQRRDGCDFREALQKAAALAGIAPDAKAGIAPDARTGLHSAARDATRTPGNSPAKKQRALVASRLLTSTPVFLQKNELVVETDRRSATCMKAPLTISSLCPSWQHRRMSSAEWDWRVDMANELLAKPEVLEEIAAARKWHPGTIFALAMDESLGLHEGRLVYLYPNAVKKRFKPLNPALEASGTSPKFTWLFGKPEYPWRATMVHECTTTIHVTEGETAAIALIDDGIDNSGGCGSFKDVVIAVPGATCWRDEWSVVFRGRNLVIWPDDDEAGEKLKERIIQSVSPYTDKIDVVPMCKKKELP